VTVEFEDNLRGQLVPHIYIENGDGIASEAVVFVNSYQITGDAQVKLEGTKTLNGMELVDGMFTFELYETDETFAITGEPIQTAVNVGGAFEMVLDYTTEDVGTTRFYVVRERNAGQTIEGVTYSDVAYYVTVDVLDDEIGGIKTEVEVTNGTQGVTSLDFENIFIPDPEDTTLEIKVEKTVKNVGEQTIGPEGFQFLLENMTIGGTQTVTADENGVAIFTLTFTKDDAGKTYNYQVSEIDDGRDYVLYSTAVYTITVEIQRNEDNELDAVITNNGAETLEPVAQFENVFDPPGEGNPGMGDSGLALWIAMLAVSCGAAVTLMSCGRPEEEDEA